ncbi:hypothetical protein LUQ84_000047 [Hamiltosporidium tvaerminnensis]|nr:hypothetical protein LUQ84_000047 [Hamiltosporidium tvaerminnensis]
MYQNQLGQLFRISPSKKNLQILYIMLFKSSNHYIAVKNILCSFFLFVFFGINNCIRINIFFNGIDRSFDSTTNLYDSNDLHNLIGRKRIRETETTFIEPNDHSFRPNKNRYLETNQSKEYSIRSKKPRLDIDSENTTNITPKYIHTNVKCNLGGDLDQINVEKSSFELMNERIKNDGNLKTTQSRPCQRTMDSITIDYSNIFIIRSRCFDILYRSKLHETNINIKDITKSNIDCFWVKKCIDILYYGFDSQIDGLNNNEFIDLIEFLNDLNCYSNTDALYILYKNLLPYLCLYIVDETCFNLLNMTNSEYLRHVKLFLPFLAVLYDKVDIFFNSNTKELTFIVKEQNRESFKYEMNFTDDTIIRITPEALNYMQQDDSNGKRELLGFLVSSYKITGIKISSSDRYYTECVSTDFACKFILNNPVIYKMQTSFCSVLGNIESIKINTLKSIEIERLDLLTEDVDFFSKFLKLESLSIVKCKFLNYGNFLRKLALMFPKLKILRIVGSFLRFGFLNNLFSTYIEILDLSCCKSIGKISNFPNMQMKALKSLRIDYSSLNYKVMRVMISTLFFENFKHERN